MKFRNSKIRIGAMVGLIIGALGLTVLMSTASAANAASDYPSKPITILVGYAAGGSTDTGARLMAGELSERLGVPVKVVNRPGANAQIEYTALSRSDPDGYTMGTINFPSAIITAIDESRGATYTRDSFAPVALQVIDPTAIAVQPDSPFQTIDDLVNAAKKNPGEITATTTGIASQEHFAILLLKKKTGAALRPIHFPGGGARAATAFLGGDVDVLVANVSDMKTLVTPDNARIIGIMESERSPFLPDVPTFAEKGYDVTISSSRGYAFPAGTPDAIVKKMASTMREIMADPEFQKSMKNVGLAPSFKGPEEYAKYWGKIGDQFKALMPLVRK